MAGRELSPGGISSPLATGTMCQSSNLRRRLLPTNPLVPIRKSVAAWRLVKALRPPVAFSRGNHFTILAQEKPAMRRRLDLSTRDITLLAVLTALPLLGYQFGVGNQVEQFPIVERLREPHFIAGDFYTDSAATFGPRYYYSLLLSVLTRIASLPVVVLLLTCAANLALVLVTFAAARTRLGATAAGAAIAAALAVANSSFPLGLAAYLRYESFQ